MNIKCPKCDTVFEYRVDEGDRVKLKFKCSVCNNIWQHNALSDTDSLNNINSPNYNILFILHIVIIILIIISFTKGAFTLAPVILCLVPVSFFGYSIAV